MPIEQYISDMIKVGEEYKRRQHSRWLQNLRLYKGQSIVLDDKKLPAWKHILEINITKPVIDAMLPMLILHQPKVLVKPPLKFANLDVSIASVIEEHLNSIIGEIKMLIQYKKAVMDALLFGNGFIQFGLTSSFGYDYDKYVYPAPFVKRRSPFEVGIDPGCVEKDFSDAEFVWFKTLVPMHRALSDPRLVQPERLKPVAVSEFYPKEYLDTTYSKRRVFEYTVLYDVWVRESKTVYITDADGVIYAEEPWLYDIGEMFPLVNISFINIPDEFYSPGEPEFLEMLQLEISEKRTQWLNHTRRFNRKYWVPLDMSEDDKKAFAEGEDGTVVTSREPPVPIADAPLSGDIAQEIALIKEEIRDVSGVAAYFRGGTEVGINTATEANLVGSASNLRIEERRQEVANAFVLGAKLLYSIIKGLFDYPSIDFVFTIDMASMKKQDDMERLQSLMQFGQVAANFPNFKADAWLREVAIALGRKPDEFLYTPEEMAMMQQAQQQQPTAEDLEIAKLQQRLAFEQQKYDLQLKQQQAKLAREHNKAVAETAKAARVVEGIPHVQAQGVQMFE